MERLKFEECKKCSDYDGDITKCFNICGKPLDAFEEYNRLKGLEEQGLLLKLPCKVGTKVYCIMTNLKGTHPMIATQKFDYSMLECFGKTVFLTQGEAEEALKGMEE